MTGLIVQALVLSIYLCWHYLAGGSMIGCSGGSSCDQVLSSRWSAIGGILPVSALAAGAYTAMLAASLFIGPAIGGSVRRLAWGTMLVIVGSVAGSAVWFTVLQKWIIGAFCPYCMTAHTTGILLAVLVVWRSLMQFGNDSTDTRKMNSEPKAKMDSRITKSVQNISSTAPRRLIGLFPTIILILVGGVMTGILAVGQVVFTPPSVYQRGESQENVPAIDPHAVPLVGSPDALYLVTLLFDYKCPHCQQMHFMLDEVVRRYDGKLAFVLCPSPLNSQCNPYLTQDMDEFKDSCELAKVSLAVWLADREVFSVFEHWMFTFESGDRWRPRSLDTARIKAVELVGQTKFNAAWANPWIDRYIQTSIRIYGNTIGNGNIAIPKLVFGSRWVIPQSYDTENFMMTLQKSLAVPGP